jgi:hypothetical protein
VSLLITSQNSSVLATCRHLDRLLSEAVRALREAGGESPFTEHAADATAVEAQAFEDAVARVRQALVRALDGWEIERPAPRSGALWAARVNVLYAEVALEELRPRALRGYGPVAPSAAEQLEATVAELRASLHQMLELLDQGRSPRRTPPSSSGER